MNRVDESKSHKKSVDTVQNENPQVIPIMGDDTGNSVGQIRDILFGALRQEYDRRFSRIEELIVNNIAMLEQDTVKKLQVQKAEYEKRSTNIEERFAKIISDLNADINKKIKQHKSESDKRFSQLEELLLNNVANLDQNIKSDISSLRNEFNVKIKELEDNMLQRFKQVNDDISRQFTSFERKIGQELDTRDRVLEKKADKAAVLKFMTDLIKIAHKHGGHVAEE